MKFSQDDRSFKINESRTLPPIVTRGQMIRLIVMGMAAVAIILSIITSGNKKKENLPVRTDVEKPALPVPLDPTTGGSSDLKTPAVAPPVIQLPTASEHETIKDRVVMDEMEWGPYYAEVARMIETPREFFIQKENHFTEFPYQFIKDRADKFRHDVYRIRGIVLWTDAWKLPEGNPLGLQYIYEGQVVQNGQIYWFQVPRLPSDGVFIDDVIDFYGSFHKIVRYESRTGKIRFTPLMLTATVRKIPPSPESHAIAIAVAVCIFVLGGLILWIIFQNSREKRRFETHYSEMRKRVRMRMRASKSQPDEKGEEEDAPEQTS